MLLVLVTLVAATIERAAIPAAVQLRPIPVAAVVVPLMVAVFFLLRSLNKQLKRIDFDETAETDEGRAANRPEADQKADH